MDAKLEGIPNKKFELVRSDNGLRDRGNSSKKNDGQMLNLFPKDIESDPQTRRNTALEKKERKVQSKEYGAFGCMWKQILRGRNSFTLQGDFEDLPSLE